jgi:hypothetical protein
MKLWRTFVVAQFIELQFPKPDELGNYRVISDRSLLNDKVDIIGNNPMS